MSAALKAMAAEILDGSFFAVEAKNAMVEKIADQLALDDDERTNIIAQREADLEEAEWMLGVIRAAGFKLVPVTS